MGVPEEEIQNFLRAMQQLNLAVEDLVSRILTQERGMTELKEAVSESSASIPSLRVDEENHNLAIKDIQSVVDTHNERIAGLITNDQNPEESM